MMHLLAEYAPLVGLLFFFSIFVGIALWVLRPGARQRFQKLALIPLEEETHG